MKKGGGIINNQGSFRIICSDWRHYKKFGDVKKISRPLPILSHFIFVFSNPRSNDEMIKPNLAVGGQEHFLPTMEGAEDELISAASYQESFINQLNSVPNKVSSPKRFSSQTKLLVLLTFIAEISSGAENSLEFAVPRLGRIGLHKQSSCQWQHACADLLLYSFTTSFNNFLCFFVSLLDITPSIAFPQITLSRPNRHLTTILYRAFPL